jgi:predicted  nucleic acid-binding Zn-ribbon protein
MEIAALALMIPIVAIVLGVGGGIVQSILKSQERRLELRLQSQQGTNEEVTTQLKALRAEIAGLRDTSTQFDMSLEHSVQRLEERLGRIESKGQSSISPAPATEETQRASLR